MPPPLFAPIPIQRKTNPRTSVRSGVEGLKRFTSSRLWSEDPEISPGWVWVVLLLLVCFLCCCLGFNTVYYKWNQVLLMYSLLEVLLCTLVIDNTSNYYSVVVLRTS